MCDVLFKGQGGGMGGPFGGMGGPMEFGKNKSKFQETPETGISFDDVAVSAQHLCPLTAHISALMVFRWPEHIKHCYMWFCCTLYSAVTAMEFDTAGLRRRKAGADGGGGLPEVARQVHQPGRQDPQGLPAGGPARWAFLPMVL
jgi:hypothetical protein